MTSLSARRYAEALSASVSGRQKADTDKRLQRISRKLSGPSGGRNGTLGYDQESENPGTGGRLVGAPVPGLCL